MSRRHQKGTGNHRCLNLFEKGWLSADVCFTILKGGILKIACPKSNVKNILQQTKHIFEIGMQEIKKTNERDHRLDPKGSPKLEMDIKQNGPGNK